jgi:predicted nucleotidyltransferase
MAFQLDEAGRLKLEATCRKYGVKSLKLFGSAATDDFDPAKSDIDLLVEFSDPPKEMRPATQYFGFKEELEALFERPVDLLEEHAIENQHLKRSALSSAVSLYAA